VEVSVDVFVGVTLGDGIDEEVGLGVIVGVGVKNESNAAAHLSRGVITLILNNPDHPPHKSEYCSING
jgi:hypothetical protein